VVRLQPLIVQERNANTEIRFGILLKFYSGTPTAANVQEQHANTEMSLHLVEILQRYAYRR
jgi:hypothetical protein